MAGKKKTTKKAVRETPSQITLSLGEQGSENVEKLARLMEAKGLTVRKLSGGINVSQMVRASIDIAIKHYESQAT